MAIYKRGSIYWYKFTFNGEAIRESTQFTTSMRNTGQISETEKRERSGWSQE